MKSSQESLSHTLSRSFSEFQQQQMRNKPTPLPKKTPPPQSSNVVRMQYKVLFAHGALYALNAVERFKELFTKNFPLAYMDSMCFYSDSYTNAVYELEYIIDGGIDENMRSFLELSKKLFHPSGRVTISFY